LNFKDDKKNMIRCSYCGLPLDTGGEIELVTCPRCNQVCVGIPEELLLKEEEKKISYPEKIETESTCKEIKKEKKTLPPVPKKKKSDMGTLAKTWSSTINSIPGLGYIIKKMNSLFEIKTLSKMSLTSQIAVPSVLLIICLYFGYCIVKLGEEAMDMRNIHCPLWFYILTALISLSPFLIFIISMIDEKITGDFEE